MWITSVYISKTYKNYRTAKMNLPSKIRDIIAKYNLNRAIIEPIDERSFKVTLVNEEDLQNYDAEDSAGAQGEEERKQDSQEQTTDRNETSPETS